jgi:cholesterol oxidase
MEDQPRNRGISRRTLLGAGLATGAGWTASPQKALAWWGNRPDKLPTEERDVIVVGSGFGGAITAHRLTEAGIPVTILEKGRRWDQPVDGRRFSPNLYPDSRSTWLSHKTVIPLGPALPIKKSTGVLQGRDMAGFRILSGAAYGGGSIVYGGVLKKPEKTIFDMVFPKEISFDSLQPHYDEVARRLNRSVIPDDVLATDYYKHVRVTKKHCDRADISTELMHTSTQWDIVRDEIAGRTEPSIIHGEAVYGVNSGAKGTLDNTYLKEAEDTGLLEVKTLHRIKDIGAREGGGYWIDYEKLDEDGTVIAVGRLLCRKLFLSAGTMGTNQLLVKAKAKANLPALNNQVGKGWGNNGNVYALRLGLESTGRWHAGPPAIGIRDYDNPLSPMFIEHPQIPIGIEFFGLLYFGIGITQTRGYFYYDKASDDVKLYWPKEDPGQAKINQRLMQTMKRLNRENGGWVTSAIDGFQEKVKDDAVYHPLGGCVMGKACDFYGRLKNYDGLYVNDGSFMPGSSACTNPSFTISALAERNIAHIIEHDFA